MNENRSIILNFKKNGLFDPIDPVGLAACSPLWDQDVKRYNPWKKLEHASIKHGSGSIFESETWEGNQSIYICGSCASSMDVAWHFIAQDFLKVWDSILAVEQTSGRGQRQRTWMSPAGNIHGAWRWPHPLDTKDLDSRWLNFTSMITGYLLARIITKECGLPIKIKWPNDLLVNDRKIGGILTEVRNDSLVVGIGINVMFSPSPSDLRNDFAVQATSLNTEGVHATPLSLWTEIVEKGRREWMQLTESLSPDDFIDALKPYLAWVGEKVLVKTIQQEPYEAIISGISKQGGLILKAGGKETMIYAGSIIPV